MERSSVETVLDEARTLANHVARTGRLPPNSRLFEEIDAVAQALVRGEPPPIAPLIGEMQKVLRASRITLDQVMRRDTIPGRFSRRAAMATPYLIGFMTLLLTLYLAFQSSELHKADLALREYQDLESERLPEKIYHAWKLYRYERVLNVQGPALAQLDSYQQLVDDSKRLYEKRAAVQNLLIDSSVIRYFPELFKFRAPIQVATTAPGASVGSASEPGAAASAASTVATNSNEALGALSAGTLECTNEPDDPSGSAKPPLYGSKAELDRYRHSIACFVQSIQIQRDYDYPMVSMIYETRNKVNLLVSWMLPGLYGLLGACVFLMRDLLRVNGLGAAHGDARIVDLLSLLLRVALGGLAGIIVGWFWVPSVNAPTSSAIPVSSLSFGVAFLAGFSIDSLFALLDRLIKNFRQGNDDKAVEPARKLGGRT